MSRSETVRMPVVTESEPIAVAELSPLYFVHGAAVVEDARQPVSYTVAVPEDLSLETLAFGVNGFGAVKRTSRNFRNALAADNGIATVSYDPVRIHRGQSPQSIGEQLCNPQQIHVKTIAAIADDLRQNPGFRNVPHGRSVQNAGLSLVLNSLGGEPGSRFAVEHHRRIDSVTFLGSIGLETRLGLRLIPRTGKVLSNAVPDLLLGRLGPPHVMAKREASYFLSNPVRTSGELINCFLADNRSRVEILAKLAVPQTALCFENDEYFHPDDTLAAVGDVIRCEIIPECRHLGMQRDPVKTAHYVGSAIKRMVG